MAQISFSLNGAFWPTSLPLFHGSWWDLLLESSMMNSLKLKGIQLSCFLTWLATLIVSFWAGSLKSQIIIKNGKRSPMPRARPALEDPLRVLTTVGFPVPQFDAEGDKRLTTSGNLGTQVNALA
jgi:hypothetical protein